MAKKQGDQYYCWGCGRTRAHEKFSGRGHARHLCKDCEKAQRQERRARRRGEPAAAGVDPVTPALALEELALPIEADDLPDLTEEELYAWMVQDHDPWPCEVPPAKRKPRKPLVPQQTLRFHFVLITTDPAIRQTVWSGICNRCRRVSPRQVRANAHSARARLPLARLQAFRQQLDSWQAAGYLRWSANPAPASTAGDS
jgi:hypothetical protein